MLRSRFPVGETPGVKIKVDFFLRPKNKMYNYFRMETARRVMEFYYPAHYHYWLTILERLATPTKHCFTSVLTSVYIDSFFPIAPYGHKSKYHRDKCLKIAAVAFPEECTRLFITVPAILDNLNWDRDTTYESIYKKMNSNPAVVDLLNLKIRIAAEKAEVKRLTAEHKETLKYLKIKKPDESVPLPE